MSEFKHTPGPWTATHKGADYWSADCDFDAASGAASMAIGSSNNRHPVALVIWPDWRDHPEHDANARLIAAAPEMVELLEEAASPWADMTDAELEHDAAQGDKHAVWLIRVRALLSKIKGEAA